VSREVALSATPDPEVLQVHCLMHSYKLSRDLQNRKRIRLETMSFANLLKEKDTRLTARERNLNRNLDINAVIQQCRAEESRWDRNWTSVKGEWVLNAIRATLSSTPPPDFFGQSYDQAFTEHNPIYTKQSVSVIQASSNTFESNIANLLSMEQEISEDIVRLETAVSSLHTPKKSSSRKSLPQTAHTHSRYPSLSSPDRPKPSKRSSLQFTKSSSSISQLSRRASESPCSMRTKIIPEHGASEDSLSSFS